MKRSEMTSGDMNKADYDAINAGITRLPRETDNALSGRAWQKMYEEDTAAEAADRYRRTRITLFDPIINWWKKKRRS
jgi:hypothetical protein